MTVEMNGTTLENSTNSTKLSFIWDHRDYSMFLSSDRCFSICFSDVLSDQAGNAEVREVIERCGIGGCVFYPSLGALEIPQGTTEVHREVARLIWKSLVEKYGWRRVPFTPYRSRAQTL